MHGPSADPTVTCDAQALLGCGALTIADFGTGAILQQSGTTARVPVRQRDFRLLRMTPANPR
jgi:hypothetical protein